MSDTGHGVLFTMLLALATTAACVVESTGHELDDRAQRSIDDAVDAIELVDAAEPDAALQVCSTDVGECGCLVPPGGSCADFGSVAVCIDAQGRPAMICQAQLDGSCVCTVPPPPPPPRPPRRIEPIDPSR